MSLWLQHVVVLAVVALCVAQVVHQGFRAIWGKASRVGSCCAKGCAPTRGGELSREKIHFLPVEVLRKRL